MLEIKNLHVHLGDFSLKNINLQIQQGAYVSILGLSGAGKTVLLEALAGLTEMDQGEIFWKNKNIGRKKIQERPMGLVYQDMALFPHLKVSENILYPLRVQKKDKTYRKKMLTQLSKLTETAHLLDRYPATLSGGEAQRVALARILASNPDILLLDEPLASMDISLKDDFRQLLRKLNRSGKTIIHVTHDFQEAASLSDQVAIIDKGALIQFGSPAEVFSKPASYFVARFSGIKNTFQCGFIPNGDDGVLTATTAKGLRVKLLGDSKKKDGAIMIPGEDILLSRQKTDTSAINNFPGKVLDFYPSQYGTELILDVGERLYVEISKKSFESMQIQEGQNLWVSFKASAVRYF